MFMKENGFYDDFMIFTCVVYWNGHLVYILPILTCYPHQPVCCCWNCHWKRGLSSRQPQALFGYFEGTVNPNYIISPSQN